MPANVPSLIFLYIIFGMLATLLQTTTVLVQKKRGEGEVVLVPNLVQEYDA